MTFYTFKKTYEGFYRTSSKLQWLTLTVLCALIIMIYMPGINAPFYLDDYSSIIENPAITGNDWSAIWAQYASRIIGYASFAANISVLDNQPASLRLVNIIVHMLMSINVFFLTKIIVSHQRSKISSEHAVFIACIAAFIFAVHPLNTSAVTYIVQRLASLAAVFYIFSLIAYFMARQSKKNLWWLLCFISIFSAVLTKQNTVSVFGALYLIEMLFFTRFSKRIVWLHITASITILIVGIALLHLAGISLSVLDNMSRETQDITRWDYFYSQLAVVGHYLTMFGFPRDLTLDYGLKLSVWLEQGNLIWGALHATLIIVSIAVFYRVPLVAFGVLFYYIGLSVESSVIPIRDVIFEHRTYLPNVGLCILSAVGFAYVINLLSSRYRLFGFLAPLIATLVLSTISYQRNTEWSNPYAFFKAEVKRNNGFWRSRNELASLYINDGQLGDALALLNIAELNESSHPSLLINALNISVQQKNVALSSQIIELFGEKLKGSHYRYKARFYSLAGQHYMRVNQMPKALDYLQKALTLRPNTVEVLANLGIANALSGNFDEAEKLLLDASLLQPSSDKLKKNLKVVEKLRIRSLN